MRVHAYALLRSPKKLARLTKEGKFGVSHEVRRFIVSSSAEDLQ